MHREYVDNGTNHDGKADNLLIDLDLSTQKLFLEIEKETTLMLGDTVIDNDKSLIRSLADLEDKKIFPSISLISLKAKCIDDRIYATIEKLCQNGSGNHFGKAVLFTGILENIKCRYDKPPRGALIIQAALELGGMNFDDKNLPLAQRVYTVKTGKIRKEFLADEKSAKPMGFYTWSSDLEKIFLQDRLLQEKFNRDEASVIADTLMKSPYLKENYEKYLAFIGKLTNPLVYPSVLDYEKQISDDFSLIPPSSSQEGELIKKLFSNAPIPEDFQLIREVIRRIRNSELSLKPTAKSGWYDYQLYCFEPFIVPDSCTESEKITWGKDYRDYLEKLFESLYAYTRETHIKQLEQVVAGGFPVRSLTISPSLSVEPFPEYYLRRAGSYRFIKNVLLEYFGETALAGTQLCTGPGSNQMKQQTLLKAVVDMESLFFGLYQISCREIGLEPQLDIRSENEALIDRANAANWIENIKEDSDIRSDSRCMVPLFFDRERRKHKVLLVMGFSSRELAIIFKEKPRIKVMKKGKNVTGKVDLRWEVQSEQLYFPLCREIYVDKLMDRKEFRQLCDSCQTEEAIIKALESK